VPGPILTRGWPSSHVSRRVRLCFALSQALDTMLAQHRGVAMVIARKCVLVIPHALSVAHFRRNFLSCLSN
jgi:hypothetical protein